MITGAVDDIWKSGDGDTEEWYVVDYKSTASNANITTELFLEDIYKEDMFVKWHSISGY